MSRRPDPERVPPIALVVDDDPTNRKVAGLLLQRFGWRSIEVSSGQEALDRVRRDEFDAVLLDLHMPEMDGITTSTAIRALGLPRQPVLIALTASVFEEDRRRCAEAGMTDFVPKPIEPGALQGALERAERLSRRRGSRVPQVAAAEVVLRSSVVPEGLDRAALDRVLGLARDAAERASLVRDYLNQSKNYLADMRKALDSDDRTLLHRAAHTLASSSALFGATHLSMICRTYENNAKQGDLKTLAADLMRIEQTFALVDSELEAVLLADRDPPATTP